MHQTVHMASSDLYEYYLDSESLQQAVDCWPKGKRAERFLSMLFSENTVGVRVVDALYLKAGKPILFEVQGKCYEDEPCTFRFELDPKELTHPQGMGVLNYVKTLYINETNQQTAKHVAKALGIPWSTPQRRRGAK